MVDFSITLNNSQKGRPPLLSFIQSSSIDFCFKLAQGKKFFYVPYYYHIIKVGNLFCTIVYLEFWQCGNMMCQELMGLRLFK